MKIRLTESQIKRLPINENFENSPLFKIYEKDCADANNKLNSYYGRLMSYNVSDILTERVNREIYNIGKIMDESYDKVYKLYRTLESKIEDKIGSAIDTDAEYDVYDKYQPIQSKVYEKYTVIDTKKSVLDDLSYKLQSLYNDLEDNEVNLNKTFGDIETIEI